MTSPFKTAETMDLARALLEEDSKSCKTGPGNTTGINNNEEVDPPKTLNRCLPFEPSDFHNVVVSKESSTELIPTQFVEEFSANFSSGKPANHSNNSKPPLMMIRDMNAGKGMLDDDGKPAVGKVFSRVIQISGSDSKPKQLKSHHRGRSSSSCCRDRHSQSQDKERSSSVRPQSGQQQQQRSAGHMRSGAQHCPRCDRQFSDETMEKHIVFCSGSSKEIM